MRARLFLIMLQCCVVQTSQAMEMNRCGDQLILSGSIEREDTYRIKDAIKEDPRIHTAVLRNSPGGNADAGYQIGEYFRERGISTYVSGFCLSSCSRMFLGGAARFFTNDYPPSQTVVGFHSNYTAAGQIAPGAQWKLKQFINKYSDGKADPALVERWVNIPYRNGFARFFHPSALNRSDKVSILLCTGHEPSNQRWRQCEHISGHDALSMGVITSTEIKRSCDADQLTARPAASESAASTPDGAQ
jgi:hypothetical protein